jgi:DNA topoisomerase-1
VDVEKGFAPKYVVPKQKKALVQEIREAANKASSVYLATDPDREGEAIAWHLVQAAQLYTKPLKRVVFHEITEEALAEAFRHPRDIDRDLVNAQQARRILDRLVGYKISPLLWRKVRRGLSAGRVQSVALRMIVDREREIEGFASREYWSIDAELGKIAAEESFIATLIGSLHDKKIQIHSEKEAQDIVAELRDASYAVAQVRKKDVSRKPSPPFTTSTLQQEGWRKLRFSAKHTMAIAQQLYEGLSIDKQGSVGLITYMRTDSTRVASSALNETRALIKEKYGTSFLPTRPRVFTKKAKASQEAHEAIRPTSAWREPDDIKRHLTRDQFRLYALIWKRMVASQMSPAVLDTTSVDIEAKNEKTYLLRATSSAIKFPGFTIIYSEGRDDAEEERESPLPELAKGEHLELSDIFPKQHFTQPPPRYTEATLVKALEERGIGRPSTYAPILSTIQDRGYVEKANGRFQPLEIGLLVSDLLTEHFPDIVDPRFTAQMEERLDQIARGEREWVPSLQDFYDRFEKTLETAEQLIAKVKVVDEPTDETCEQCGRPMVIKWGRYGRFIACSGYPECKKTKPLLVKIGVKCPKCGGDIVEKQSKRKRIFYGCASYPGCKFATSNKPLPQPCPQCGDVLVVRGKGAKCLKCEFSTSLTKLEQEREVLKV